MNKLVVMSEEDIETLLNRVIRQAINHSGALQDTAGPEYLDIGQAAKFLRMSESALYSYTSQRKIPFIKRGRRLHFKRTELLAWLDGGRKKTREELATEMGIAQKGGKR